MPDEFDCSECGRHICGVELEIEADIVDCAECGVPIKTLWVTNKGLLPSEDYLLIADWIFHPDCWSKSVEGYLTEEEQRVIKQ